MQDVWNSAEDFPPAAVGRWTRAYQGLTLTLMLVSGLQAALLLRSGALHGNDFKHLWGGAWLLLHGLNPYDPALMLKVAQNFQFGGVNPFVYLPSTGWLLAPLAWLPFPTAKVLWFGGNWLLAWACVWLGPRWLQATAPARARFVGAGFLCAAFPFYRQMTAGQMNVVTAALLLLAAGLLLRRRHVLLGLVLALGFAWKISPVLLIPALLLLRRPRAAVAGVLGVLLALVLMFAATPYDTFTAGFSTVGEMGYGRSTWAQFGMDFYRDPFNQSINALLHHLLTQNPHTTPWRAWSPFAANQLTLVTTLLLGLAWLVAVWGQFPHRRVTPWPAVHESTATLRLFWGAVVLMLLAPSLMWDHYMVQLLPIWLWLAGRRGLTRHPRAVALLLGCLAAMCFPWMHGAPAWRAGWGILLMSLRLWPTLALFFLLLFYRRLDVDDEEFAA